MSDESIILCPYCGLRQRFATGCTACGGRFDAWSLAATQNEMGAWFVRDSKRPHFVGCSHATIVAAIRAGEIGRDSIVRGPSTRQFWTVARRAAGLAHLFGRCHACQGPVLADKPECGACGADPLDWRDRNHLGLPAIESFAPPAAALDPHAIVATAFVREGGIYFVRTAPVPPPGSTTVRVTPPPFERIDESAPAAPVAPAVPREPAAVEKPSAPAERSPLDRSLAERVRSVERTNRILFLATVFAAMLALVLGGAYIFERDSRAKAIAAAREEAIRGLRAEFERTQPVTKPKAVDLPSEPEPLPTGAQPPTPSGRR
jgi:hypothetical protein